MRLIRKRNQAWATISPAASASPLRSACSPAVSDVVRGTFRFGPAASASPLLVLLIFVVVSGKALAAGKTNTCRLDANLKGVTDRIAQIIGELSQ